MSDIGRMRTAFEEKTISFGWFQLEYRMQLLETHYEKLMNIPADSDVLNPANDLLNLLRSCA